MKEVYATLVGDDEAVKAEQQRDEQEAEDRWPFGGITNTLTGF